MPPHIWADEEADDASRQVAALTAAKFGPELVASGRRLQEVTFRGACTRSIKFQPSRPGQGWEDMAWLWTVIYQRGLTFLLGLSEEERQQLI